MTARTPVAPAYGVARTDEPIDIGVAGAASEGNAGQVTDRKYPDMWVDPEDDPRETGALAVGEKAVLRSISTTSARRSR